MIKALLNKIIPIQQSFNLNTFTLSKINKCFASYHQHRRDILLSQFHKQGHRHFQKSKLLTRTIDTTTVQIDKTLVDLQKKRRLLLQVQNTMIQPADQTVNSEIQQYFKSYLNLLKLIEDSRLNQEWYYRIVGWYNIQPMRITITDKILTCSNKNQHLQLLQAVNWMTPHRVAYTTMGWSQLMREKRKFDVYFKTLNVGHDIRIIKVVESKFGQCHNSTKGKFYQSYMKQNLKRILQESNVTNDQAFDDVLWLMWAYVMAHNDEREVIAIIQIFICKRKQLNQQHFQMLMKVYATVGKIGKEIYQKHMKRWLLKQSQINAESACDSLQFMIYSEAQDVQTLNNILKNIVLFAKNDAVADMVKLKVHYLLHYLKIKEKQFQFPINLWRQYVQICRKNGGNSKLARISAIQLDQKGRRQGKTYFISDCLRKNRGSIDTNEQDDGVVIDKLPDFKKYSKVKFCCIQLQSCVYNPQNFEVTVLQRNYMKYSPSGLVNRQLQVRDQLLSHYGVNINYLEAKGRTQSIQERGRTQSIQQRGRTQSIQERGRTQWIQSKDKSKDDKYAN